MAIKTVTAENLAEFVQGKPQSEGTEAKIEAKVTANTGVVGEGTETVSTAPNPGPQPPPEERKKISKEVFQERLQELVTQRNELDEAFQTEYEQRLRLEGELKALKTAPPKEEKPPEDIRPDRTKYSSEQQDKYENDLLAWNRREARREYEAEQARVAQEARAREAEAAMFKKVAMAKADLPDFEDVIDQADKRSRQDLPGHIKAAIYDSDVGAHLLYHLAKDVSEERRIFGMPVAKAILELGKIEQKYLKQQKQEAAPPAPAPTNLPTPVTKLKESSGSVPTDLSQPMSFTDYRAQRLEQLRANSGRRRYHG